MKYGVMLADYDGQIFDMWVWDTEKQQPFQTEDVAVASSVANDYKERNPKGRYLVKVYEE